MRHSRSAWRDAAAAAEGVDDEDEDEDDGARGSGATEPKRTDGDGAALACADACDDDEDEVDDDEVDDDDESMAETLRPRGSSRNEQPSESRWPVAGVCHTKTERRDASMCVCKRAVILRCVFQQARKASHQTSRDKPVYMVDTTKGNVAEMCVCEAYTWQHDQYSSSLCLRH